MATYYEEKDLEKFATVGDEVPELWEKFMAYYGATLEEGDITAREKALIAFAVALAVQCPYCIDSYTQNCLSKGVTEKQLTEVAHVTSAIKCGATLVHGVQMKNAVGKLGL